MRLRHVFARWTAWRQDAVLCRRAVELVNDYLEDALGPEEREWYERHLARCRACTIYLDQMRLTVSVLARLEPEQLPPDVLAGLVALYRQYRAN